MRKAHLKICTTFLQHEKKNYSNLRTDGNALYSYDTKIAWWLDDGRIAINTNYYSMTTTKQTNSLKQLAREKGIDFVNVEVDEEGFFKYESGSDAGIYIQRGFYGIGQ